MNDDERDAMIRRLAQDSLQPPPAPREELWARIEAARKAAGDRDPAPPLRIEDAARPRGGAEARPSSARRWAPLAWPAGIAALLALAFGLGRVSAPDAAPTTAEMPGRGAALPLNPAHRLVAAEYLGRTEVFLTDFRVSARAGQPDDSAPREARRLLGTARLLLDSPVAEDVRLRALLEDLELVLAEIAQLEGEPHRDLDLVTDGLDQRGTLGRLRAAVPAGGTPTSTQGVL